jgi:hypothetical protein
MMPSQERPQQISQWPLVTFGVVFHHSEGVLGLYTFTLTRHWGRGHNLEQGSGFFCQGQFPEKLSSLKMVQGVVHHSPLQRTWVANMIQSLPEMQRLSYNVVT